MTINEIFESSEIQQLCKSILFSHERIVGEKLLTIPTQITDKELVAVLYNAPIVILAHDGDDDPKFTFANLKAQNLWGYSWKEFIGLPSRLSAEKQETDTRQEFLDEVKKSGFCKSYTGIRISKNKTRFKIIDITLWNIADEQSIKIGQAACFKNWIKL